MALCFAKELNEIESWREFSERCIRPQRSKGSRHFKILMPTQLEVTEVRVIDTNSRADQR